MAAGIHPEDTAEFGEPRGSSALVVAFLVALTLHVGALLAVAFLQLTAPTPPGEQHVTMDLAPLMTESSTEAPSIQQQQAEIPPEAQPVEKPAEAETMPPPPEVAEVKPQETPTEAPPQTQALTEAPPDAVPVEPESQVITSTAPDAEPLAPPPPVTAEEPKPVEPAPPKVDLAKLKAEREAKLKAIREAKRREELAEERREAAKEAKLKAAREAKARQQRAVAGETRSSAASSAQNAAGRAAAGNDPSAMRQWTGAISSAIHGRMNSGAAAGTAGGTALVRFTVMRSGQVSGAGLARSSGIGQIDSAALSAVRGSLPPAPPGVTQASLTVTIPLNFRVR